MGTKKEVIRKRGRFVPGHSGNPAGRPRGTKNRITTLKQDLEVLLREDIVKPKDIRDVWNAMVEAAKEGNVSAGKLILDKTVSQATNSDEEGGDKGGITIKVTNLTLAADVDETDIIEGEYTEDS